MDMNLLQLVCKGSHIMLPLIWWTRKNKVAYQVTSTVRRSKIEGTTEKFVKNKLYKDIDELYILILNDDPHKYRNDNNEIDIKTTKKFTINNVINFEN